MKSKVNLSLVALTVIVNNSCHSSATRSSDLFNPTPEERRALSASIAVYDKISQCEDFSRSPSQIRLAISCCQQVVAMIDPWLAYFKKIQPSTDPFGFTTKESDTDSEDLFTRTKALIENFGYKRQKCSKLAWDWSHPAPRPRRVPTSGYSPGTGSAELSEVEELDRIQPAIADRMCNRAHTTRNVRYYCEAVSERDESKCSRIDTSLQTYCKAVVNHDHGYCGRIPSDDPLRERCDSELR